AASFGRTMDTISADGWAIAEQIPMLEDSDTPESVAASTGRGVARFAHAYARQRLDLVVVLGDRFEMLSAAVAALPFALPVAHIHGGEASEGAMDNQIRHAITKLAHLHFASAPEHARRLAAMGEEAWRIHTVGAPGLDRLRAFTPMSRAHLATALPPVNVGSGQRGRLRAANVVDVEPRRDEILHAIHAALAPAFRRPLEGLANPYGDGHAAARIVKVLREAVLDARLIQKRERDH